MKSLPNNDLDLQLARKINACNVSGESVSGLQDPLIQELLSYKSIHSTSTTSDTVDKENVWNRIKSETEAAREGSRSAARIFSLSNQQLWRIAAAILLIGAIFSFIVYQYTQPDLLAQSGPTIESVQLSDGTKITLRPYSKLFAVQEKKTSEIYRLEGEGFFDVASHTNREFSIETKQGIVTVLGTRFNLSTWSNQTQVYLEEGSVKVTALEQDRSVILKPGESALISNKTTTPTINLANVKEFTDWLDNQLFFENKAAGFVVEELEHHFDIEIAVPREIAATTLSGRLTLEDLESSLKDLETVLGGSFKKTGNKTYIFEAN